MGKKNKKKQGSSQEPAQQQGEEQAAAQPPAQPPPAEPQPQASGGRKQKKGGREQLAPPEQPQIAQPQELVPPPGFQPPVRGPPGFQQPVQLPPGFQPPPGGQGPPSGRQQPPQQAWGQQPGASDGRGQQRPGGGFGRGQPRPRQPDQQPGQPDQQQHLGQPGQQKKPGAPFGRGQPRQGPPDQQQQRPGPPDQHQQQHQQRPGPPGQQQRPGPPEQQQHQQQRPGPPDQQQQHQQQRPGPPDQQQQQQQQRPGPPGQQQPGQPDQQKRPGGRGQPRQGQTDQQQRPGPPGGQGQQPQTRPPQGAAPTPRQQPPAGKVDDVIITKGVRGLGLKVPPRRNMQSGGTKGRRTVIETNHLALDITRAKTNRIVHYDVKIEPDKPKRLIRPVMEQFRFENYPQRFPAFDGRKNMYSSGYLPFQNSISGTVAIQDEESRTPKEFRVTINYANTVNLDELKNYMQMGSSQDPPMEVIQAVDIVLREASAASRSFVQVGRSFFTPPTGQVFDLGEGLELWYGFYQSAILGWRPFVNIDVAHKGFPKAQNVVHLICDLFRLNPNSNLQLNHYQVDDLNKFLRTLKVDYEIPNQPNTKRCYRVNSVANTPGNLRFKLENGQELTVLEYFTREKRLRLKYPDLPCLNVGSLNRPSPILVPVELCTVKSQVIVRKMTENQTSNMIKVAATSADRRKAKIMDALNKAGFNRSRTVQEFGFSVSDQFEKIPARILDAPPLAYHNEQMERPVRGVWRAKHFLVGSELKDWVVLNMNGRYTQEDKLRYFCTDMRKAGEGLGMRIAEARPPYTIDCHPRDVQRKLEDYLQSVKGIQLVVVVVPDRGDTYAKVKQIAELQVGVLTQCVKGKTMGRMNPSTIGNILLKVNSKLNGINHSLQNSAKPPCLMKPVMIVGADVTHPSPDQTEIPSVAAVCASHDPRAFRYNIQYRLQGPREEIIRDLENIMKQHLLFFYRSTNNHKPEKIIFYRDGVSEGQFAQVLNEELQAIRRACQSLSPDYQPKITFLVVQKRHHTRFFPLKQEDMDGKNMNVPPGTVVDTEITHPTEMDFYLVSHASIQGTSRPTKYRRLWDDNDMSEDEVEQLTYYLCHMFSRCTRAVSYPTPTYYAHLAAYRARVYIEGQKIKLNNLPEEQRRRSIQENISKGSPMFFV